MGAGEAPVSAGLGGHCGFRRPLDGVERIPTGERALLRYFS